MKRIVLWLVKRSSPLYKKRRERKGKERIYSTVLALKVCVMTCSNGKRSLIKNF